MITVYYERLDGVTDLRHFRNEDELNQWLSDQAKLSREYLYTETIIITKIEIES